MRKILAVICLMLIMSSAGYGAISDDMGIYVRRDVFDAKMEAFMGELRLMNEQLRSDIRALETRLGGEIRRVETRQDGLEARIGDLRNDIYLGFVLLGIIIAWPRAREVLQKIGKTAPSVTLEDVKRLVEEQIEKNNAKLGKSLQV